MKPTLRMVHRIPRILRFVIDKWTLGNRLERNYPRLYKQAFSIPLSPSADQTENQLLQTIEQVKALNMELTYYTIVTILLMQIYNAFLRRQLKKIEVDFQQFDLLSGMDELHEYDPAIKMQTLHYEYQNLPESARRLVETGDYAALYKLPEATFFYQNFSSYLAKFGHLSDTTGHFGSPPWRETPGLILQLIAKYKAPEPINTERLRYDDLSKRSHMLRIFYNRARQFRLFREKYSSLFSYGLMLFRAYYLAIGERFVQRGILGQALNILFLYDDEVCALIAGQTDGAEFSQLVATRQQEMERDREVILPEVIFGNVAPLILRESSRKLSGVPASKGYYTGKARLIRSVNDFKKLEDGDILVIPFSDVSWTPLFAKAGAVVAESGGILSHSSIIAREYQIPAVVSVPGAMQLQDEMLVTVDGYQGEVILNTKSEN
jgi:pyruvate,water dikinase